MNHQLFKVGMAGDQKMELSHLRFLVKVISIAVIHEQPFSQKAHFVRDTLVGGERSHHCANPAPLLHCFPE